MGTNKAAAALAVILSNAVGVSAVSAGPDKEWRITATECYGISLAVEDQNLKLQPVTPTKPLHRCKAKGTKASCFEWTDQSNVKDADTVQLTAAVGDGYLTMQSANTRITLFFRDDGTAAATIVLHRWSQLEEVTVVCRGEAESGAVSVYERRR